MAKHILGQIRQAVEQLNPHEVRATAEKLVKIQVRASSSDMYAAIEDWLAPRGLSRARRFELAESLYRDGDPGSPDLFDMEIVEAGLPMSRGAIEFDPDQPNALVGRALDRHNELGLPLARLFPVFRLPVSKRIIHTISKENAVFALTTALPDLAPGISLPWAVPEAISDTSVLTVNQIRMAFLLAAANDRPIGYREQKAEIASIIAGAFGWRALARQMVSKIPFGGGIVPKAAIAYAATYAEGISLERLYRQGHGLSRKERRLAYGEALGRGRQIVGAIYDALRKSKGAATYEKALKTR